MYELDDEDGGGSGLKKIVAGVAALAIVALGWFVVRPALADGGDDGGQTTITEAPAGRPTGVTIDAGGGAPMGDETESAARASSAPDGIATRERPSGTTDPAGTVEVSTTTDAPTTVAESTTTETSTTAGEATTTVAPTTVAPTTVVAGPVNYDTLPDGSPAPVVAIFDANQVTLTGTVPSEPAKARLEALAIANSKFPVPVVNNLLINPAVPINVGVRVIELTASRFPENSAEILPEQALEFDRVVTVMNALPNVTALVIGHADQRGDDAANFTISEARARAAVAYLVFKGIHPSRLASRAVGEADLLSLNNDDAAFALNRRTEFVFYGLLIG